MSVQCIQSHSLSLLEVCLHDSYFLSLSFRRSSCLSLSPCLFLSLLYVTLSIFLILYDTLFPYRSLFLLRSLFLFPSLSPCLPLSFSLSSAVSRSLSLAFFSLSLHFLLLSLSLFLSDRLSPFLSHRKRNHEGDSTLVYSRLHSPSESGTHSGLFFLLNRPFP